MQPFPWAAFLIGIVWAQPVDITRQRLDPLTYTFEDGRTTLTDYVISQLRQHSLCCGVDNIYVEIRITPEGNVENVRAMTGRNECYKQSVRDIILPIRWKVENFRTTRPIYYELRFSEECKGTPQDNVYKPIPNPAASLASSPPPPSPPPTSPPPVAQQPSTPPQEEPKREEPKPIALTPSVPGTTPPKEKPQPAPPSELAPPQPKSEPKQKSEPEPYPESKKPAPPVISSEPARKGYQPGKEPPKEAQSPNPPAVLGRLPDRLDKLTVAPPKAYRSTGEKRPPNDHLSSYVNTAGPRYAEPDYINGPIAKALYLKQAYRKRGVCGLVHVLLELAIDAQGNVRGYRILKSNRPDVEIATPQVLAEMKYKPVPLPTVFYTEFKIDVDCQSDQARAKLDSVPDFLSSPEGKLIRPATPPRP